MIMNWERDPTSNDGATPGQQEIEVEQNSSFQCTWMPNFVVIAIRGGDEDNGEEAGYIDDDAEVHFSENWVHANFATTAEELKARLRLFRSRRRR